MKKVIALCSLLFALCALGACDLQPKITSLPDNVGGFIEDRYPALLADPETQPEIYNSAATDYGVYASPELYGTVNVDDYIMYSSVDDYTLKTPDSAKVSVIKSNGHAIIAEPVSEPIVVPAAPAPATVDDYLRVPTYEKLVETTEVITVGRGDTLYSLSKKHEVALDELAGLNNLKSPYSLSVGQKLKIPVIKTVVVPVTPVPVIPVKPAIAPVMATPVSAEVVEITVQPKETLYSISRKYSLPVNDLAVMNKLSPPFALSVGQKLKVPKITNVAMPDKTIVPVKAAPTPVVVTPAKPTTVTVPVTTTPKTTPATPPTKPTTTVPREKISSAPTAPLPKIASRSGTKFSWPARGKILSDFGAKPNGLYNDGINIGATTGTTVNAAENGVVAYAGNELKGMGNLIIVQHADGWMTVYAHLDDLGVRRGTKVGVGQKIGTVGQTGKVDRPQLHFEIRKGTKAYNPSEYLKK